MSGYVCFNSYFCTISALLLFRLYTCISAHWYHAIFYIVLQHFDISTAVCGELNWDLSSSLIRSAYLLLKLFYPLQSSSATAIARDIR